MLPQGKGVSSGVIESCTPFHLTATVDTVNCMEPGLCGPETYLEGTCYVES